MALRFDDSHYAAVILAGGDGIRLSAFTRKIFGHHLPKQFCPLFEGKTLLEQPCAGSRSSCLSLKR